MTGFAPVTADDDADNDKQFSGHAYISGPSWAQLPALTVGLLGAQVLWSIEMGYASPYLLTLGLSKSGMAVVFLAGPLSGLIVQPVIGVLADNSTSRFGRRRPYMIGATLISVFGMLLLGFTRNFASLFSTAGSSWNDTLTIWLAIWAIYCIDFSVNAVQAADRALVVDTLPSHEQASGNAWAARMLSFGSVAGFFIGNMDLHKLFPFFGTGQLPVLSILGSAVLLGSHCTTAMFVKERVLIASSESRPKQGSKFVREFRKMWQCARSLPRVIRQIFLIQFFSWIAWFPVLFYATLYIGELYKRSLSSSSPEAQDPTAVEEAGTRLGSRALFLQSLLNLAASLLLPFIVPEAGPPDELRGSGWKGTLRRCVDRVQIPLAMLWAIGHGVFAICLFSTFFISSVAGGTILIMLMGISWAITSWAPYSLLGEAILLESPSNTQTNRRSILLADARPQHAEEDDEQQHFLVGRDDEDEDGASDEHGEEDDDDEDEDEDEEEENVTKDKRNFRFTKDHPDSASFSRVSSLEQVRPSLERHRSHRSMGSRGGGDEDEDEGAHGLRALMSNAAASVSTHDVHSHTRSASLGRNGSLSAGDEERNGAANLDGRKNAGLSAQAGVILGLHNVSIVIPQFITTALSSVLFSIFDPDKSVLHGKHPGQISSNGTSVEELSAAGNATFPVAELLSRDDATADDYGPNSVAIIFRIGGVCAFIACILALRLAREMKQRRSVESR